MIDGIFIPPVLGLFFAGYVPHLAWCWWMHHRDVRYRVIIERWLLELPDGEWRKQ